MKACRWVGRYCAHMFGDKVRDCSIVGIRENVVEGLPVWPLDDVNMASVEAYLGQTIVLAQPVKPAWVVRQQFQSCVLSALA
jgi:hypothetical protein